MPILIMLLVIILAYCLRTELPPVGAITVTENSGADCAWAFAKMNGTVLESVMYTRTAKAIPETISLQIFCDKFSHYSDDSEIFI
jgi:hypothetical protein